MVRALFYRTFGCDPFFNMACDEWLFRRAAARPATLFLRLYSWSPGALTFGFNQRPESALDLAKAAETAVIRRITGGRALYHDPSELTYAVAANADGLQSTLFDGSPARSSEAIASALTSFLSRVGIDCEYARSSAGGSSRPDFFHKAPCFASTARHEVTSGARKIVASAQKRVGATFFQHGSIKLRGVATHPALALNPAPGDAALWLRPVEQAEFNSLADTFLEAMRASLAPTIVETCFSREDEQALMEAACVLKQNPLDRREIF